MRVVRLLLLQISLRPGLLRLGLCVMVFSRSLAHGADRRLSVHFSRFSRLSRHLSVDSRSPSLGLCFSVCVSRSRLSIFGDSSVSLFQDLSECENDALAANARAQSDSKTMKRLKIRILGAKHSL